MDKAQEATAPPPNFGDQPPPYPGTVDPGKSYAGGFQQPPPVGPPPGKPLSKYSLNVNEVISIYKDYIRMQYNFSFLI